MAQGINFSDARRALSELKLPASKKKSAKEQIRKELVKLINPLLQQLVEVVETASGKEMRITPDAANIGLPQKQVDFIKSVCDTINTNRTRLPLSDPKRSQLKVLTKMLQSIRVDKGGGAFKGYEYDHEH